MSAAAVASEHGLDAPRLDDVVDRAQVAARAAFADPSVRTNPRIPLVSELLELLEAGYSGR